MKYSSFFLICAMLAIASKVDAMPSLDPFHSLTFETDTERYTLIRDEGDPLQWYYIANRPRLVTKADGLPSFTFLRYELPSATPGALPETGGILQFEAVLDLPPGLGPQIREYIASQVQQKLSGSGRNGVNEWREAMGLLPTDPLPMVTAAGVSLVSMPFKSASVGIYLPGADANSPSTLLAASSATENMPAPTSGTQSMPFTIEVTQNGSDVYEQLIKGRTGIQLVYQVEYEGITPAVGFDVTVDWDQTYKHVSDSVENQNSMAGNFFGANVEAAFGISSQNALDELKKSKSLIIESTGMPPEMEAAYLQPVLLRIQKELWPETPQPDVMVDPILAQKVSIERATLPPASNQGGASAPNDGEGAPPPPPIADSPPPPPGDGAPPPPPGPGEDAVGDAVGDKVGTSVPNIIPTFKTETQYAMKSVEQRKSGKEVVSFKSKDIATKGSAFGGFIGIGQYSEYYDVLIPPKVSRGNWQVAQLGLPVASPEMAKMGVSRISMTAALHDEQGNPVPNLDQQAAYFRVGVDQSWVGADGLPLQGDRLIFPLGALADQVGVENLTKYLFLISTYLDRAGSPQLVDQRYLRTSSPAGGLPVVSADSVFDFCEVRSTGLPLGRELEEVIVTLESGNQTRSDVVVPRESNYLIYSRPQPGAEPISVKVTADFIPTDLALSEFTVTKEFSDVSMVSLRSMYAEFVRENPAYMPKRASSAPAPVAPVPNAPGPPIPPSGPVPSAPPLPPIPQ